MAYLPFVLLNLMPAFNLSDLDFLPGFNFEYRCPERLVVAFFGFVEGSLLSLWNWRCRVPVGFYPVLSGRHAFYGEAYLLWDAESPVFWFVGVESSGEVLSGLFFSALLCPY